MSVPAPTTLTNYGTVVDMTSTTHTYEVAKPFGPAPTVAMFSYYPVTLVARGVNWRKGQPVNYIFVSEPGHIMGPMPAENVAEGMTQEQMDEAFYQAYLDDKAADEVYEAQVAEAREKGLL
jgi:hypothetical protein